MPQNIVVGDEAEQVAEFVAEYAGNEVDRPTDAAATRPRSESTEEEAGAAATADGARRVDLGSG